MMGATSRMVVRRKGSDKAAVLACTLLAYEPQFELGATLKEARADTLDGKPAQLLVLDIPGHLSAKEKEDLKHFEAQLKSWPDADGAPRAREETYRFTGRKFLIGFGGSESVSARFAVVGSCLVAIARTSHATFSGFGQDNDTSTTTSLRLK